MCINLNDIEKVKKKTPLEIRRGRRVELLIYEMGFSSIYAFAKFINTNYYNIELTEDTISNIVKGKGARFQTLLELAKGLSVPASMLIEEYIPFVDDYIQEVYENSEQDENWREAFKKEQASLRKGKYEWSYLRYLYQIAQIFCGSSSERATAFGKEIFTYTNFMLYLPLCRPEVLIEALKRIGGEVIWREDYIIQQFAWVYREIPDIPAKRFADCQVELQPLLRKLKLTQEEEEKKRKLKAFTQTKEYEEGYEQYESLLSRWRTLLNENLMREILKNRFPELYGEQE